MRKIIVFSITIIVLMTVIITSCRKEAAVVQPVGTNEVIPELPEAPFDYETVSLPPHILSYLNLHPELDRTPLDNPITNDGATLGRVLFYDKQLSKNNATACASCHHQDKAFAENAPKSMGFEGGLTRRNSMSTVNLRYSGTSKMFWDLRAPTLERQTLMPIQDHIEMGLTLEEMVAKLSATSYYPGLFKNAFGSAEITPERVSKALSQFLRSITSFRSKYDEGVQNDFANFSESEKRGRSIFKSFFCVECHSDLSTASSNINNTYLVTDNIIGNNGLNEQYEDNGVGEISGKPEDMGLFKTPSLRNVELTAPYMHDGRFATLEEVLEHYSSGIKAHPNLSLQLVPGGVHFSDQQKADVMAFLKTLTDHELTTDERFSNPFR